MSSTSTPQHDDLLIACDRARTAELLDFHQLVDAIADAALELEAGRILSPERMVVPMGNGGVMLSMPATAHDIGIHKLVNVHPGNADFDLPTIHSSVTVCDAVTGKIQCLLDGPEVTGRRTAGVTLLAMRTALSEAPKHIVMYGTGVQARYHVQAINAFYPKATLWVAGRTLESSQAFCKRYQHLHGHLKACGQELPEQAEVIILVTTSTTPLYNLPAQEGRLVIGVGAFKPEMAEIGADTLAGSTLIADDPAGARHEAGDLIQAGIDWTQVHSLAAMLKGTTPTQQPLVFKSVGTAAWDLAAARTALKSLHLTD
ncbi:bifunctional Delta(1)-pyrroline-2-carboxylate/Delta(1)-piperideine-2-carboxylate reductase [Pokkaliibacter sp. CJK22405]|uniref:bifunctional Delta(1)-pyrroline-2-carboxylate/Delta(1)-piperideine-2- carboxylate reductase n=1 Tax=Pokkaliibacter sp. CJK22405 TaxID=3384615 RepID=UPI003984CCBA